MKCIFKLFLAIIGLMCLSEAQAKVEDADFHFNFAFNKKQLYNGEALVVTPSLTYSKNVKYAAIDKVKYSWDGKTIDTEKKVPHKLGFELINQSTGQHVLKIESYVMEGGVTLYGPFTFSYNVDIIGTLDGITKAKMDDPQYIVDFAWKNYKGEGIQKDFQQAEYWFNKAADKGNAEAAYAIAEILNSRKEYLAASWAYEKAAKLYEKVVKSNSNNYKAWLNLGLIYKHTTGVPIKCFEEAIKSSDINIRSAAQYEIGLLYEEGGSPAGQKGHYYTSSIKKDIDIAKSWYRKSANSGYDKAIAKLNELEGVNPSPNPKPNNVPILTWISPTNDTDNSNYKLKIGINSTSNIESSSIYLNGELYSNRGIHSVNNDGFTSTIEQNIQLISGINNIKVTVKNSTGTSSLERSITLKSHISPSFSERRIALVMGNASYNGENRLANPVNDATDLANKLETLGFKVLRVLDQGKQGMETAITKFGHEAADYDVALFYYAGHGVRVDGTNYLVPIDANLPDETSVKYNCTNANQVLDYMDKAHCKMKIVILDACRNNPFERSWHRGLEEGGLSTMNAPVGTLIAFSTAPGSVAADGKKGQRNSPYTSALLQMLDKPNVSLTDFFQDVLNIVYDKTNGQQTPWTSNSFIGKFYFNKK